MTKQAVKLVGKGKGVNVDNYHLLVISLFCSWKDNTEKKEGKDKCQSVETCLGIWGRREERERERERQPGGRATTVEGRHKHFPSFPLELKCRERKIKIDLLEEIKDFGYVGSVNVSSDFSCCAIPCFDLSETGAGGRVEVIGTLQETTFRWVFPCF